MPLDFGFVPGTCGGDGDPLDLMVLNEAELAVGCLVTVRLLGAIEVEQGEGEKSERNDRLVARLTDSRAFAQGPRSSKSSAMPSPPSSTRFFETYKAAQGPALRRRRHRRAGARRRADRALDALSPGDLRQVELDARGPSSS